jgi:hypothetical protein
MRAARARRAALLVGGVGGDEDRMIGRAGFGACACHPMENAKEKK